MVDHIPDLAHCWREWTSVIAWFVRRRDARGWFDAQGYLALHRSVLEACSEQAAKAQGEEKAFYERLAQLAQPWVSTEGLQYVDREILAKLLVQCREAQQRLEGRAGHTILGRLLRPAVVMLLGAAIVTIVLASDRSGTTPVLDRVEHRLRQAAYAVRHSKISQRIFVAAPVVMLTAIWVIRRSVRSY